MRPASFKEHEANKRIDRSRAHAERGILEEMAADRDASSFIRVLVELTSDDYADGFCKGARDALDHPA
jgi:hypothetical protein